MASTSFLDLPGELRMLIYDALWVPLTDPNSTNGSELTRALPTTSSTCSDLNILSTCRQIYYEAYRMAYSRHTFTIGRELDISALPPALDPSSPISPLSLITAVLLPGHLPKKNKKDIDCFEPVFGSFPFKSFCQLVRRFPSLTTIILGVNESNISGVKRNMSNRIAHVAFRNRKAREMGDERLAPNYALEKLSRGEGLGGSPSAWRLVVKGKEMDEGWSGTLVGRGEKSAMLLIVKAE